MNSSINSERAEPLFGLPIVAYPMLLIGCLAIVLPGLAAKSRFVSTTETKGAAEAACAATTHCQSIQTYLATEGSEMKRVAAFRVDGTGADAQRVKAALQVALPQSSIVWDQLPSNGAATAPVPIKGGK